MYYTNNKIYNKNNQNNNSNYYYYYECPLETSRRELCHALLSCPRPLQAQRSEPRFGPRRRGFFARDTQVGRRLPRGARGAVVCAATASTSSG